MMMIPEPGYHFNFRALVGGRSIKVKDAVEACERRARGQHVVYENLKDGDEIGHGWEEWTDTSVPNDAIEIRDIDMMVVALEYDSPQFGRRPENVMVKMIPATRGEPHYGIRSIEEIQEMSLRLGDMVKVPVITAIVDEPLCGEFDKANSDV